MTFNAHPILFESADPMLPRHRTQHTTHPMSRLTIPHLYHLFPQTFSPDAGDRQFSESFITRYGRTADHAFVVLSFILEHRHHEDDIGRAAAIHFKNFIKKVWSREISISSEDRTMIKDDLFEFMCAVHPSIQPLVGESIAIIASYDFPRLWRSALPALTSRLGEIRGSNLDWDGINGALVCADSIWEQCRISTYLLVDILDDLTLFEETLAKLFLNLVARLQALAHNRRVTLSCLKAITTTCHILYSLTCKDVPNNFKYHIDVWMEGFATLSEYKNYSLVDNDEDVAPGPVENMHVALIRVVDRFLNRNEESVVSFLPKISFLVQNVLMNASPLAKHNEMATTCIRFLSSLIGNATCKHLFQDERTVEVILQRIVIPNLMIREIDELCFEEDPEEFVLSDMEGRDEESRRQCTRKLLGAMCLQFKKQTTAVCWQHIRDMLVQFATDKSQWKMKECILHLIYGIFRPEGFRPEDIDWVNGMDLADFFYHNILIELQEDELTVNPMLRATCINFLGIFRNDFTKEQLDSLMPSLIAHLKSPHVVVYTYAAATIEKFLTLEVDGPNNPKRPEVAADPRPWIQTLFLELLSIVDNHKLNENEYVMKCLLRALDSVRDDIMEVAEKVFEKLSTALAFVMENPKNPQYNRYLFECIAILIRCVCDNDAALGSAFEPFLFPSFQYILQKEVVELTPYVFQIFAQLLEFRAESARLGPTYGCLLSPILTPSLWESKRNIPSLAILLKGYLNKGSAEIAQQNLLSGILEVVKTLIESETAFTYAFDLLEAIVLYFPCESFFFHTKEITHILVMNLQNEERPGYSGRATHYFALCIAMFGAQTCLDQLNQFKGRTGLWFSTEIWVPNLEAEPPKGNEAKTQVIGLTNLLCETPSLFVGRSGEQIWRQILTCALNVLFFRDDLFSAVTDECNQDAEGIDDEGATYMLHFATQPAKDPFANVLDAGNHLVRSLTHARVSQPDSFIPLFRFISLRDRARLETLCEKAGVSLIL